MPRHEILGGKVQLYRRTSKVWHCSASLKGVQHRGLRWVRSEKVKP